MRAHDIGFGKTYTRLFYIYKKNRRSTGIRRENEEKGKRRENDFDGNVKFVKRRVECQK